MFPFIFPLAVVGSLVYNLIATNHEIEVIKETEDNEQRKRQVESEYVKEILAADKHYQTEVTKRRVILMFLIIVLSSYVYAFFSKDSQLPLEIIATLVGTGGSIWTSLWQPKEPEA